MAMETAITVKIRTAMSMPGGDTDADDDGVEEIKRSRDQEVKDEDQIGFVFLETSFVNL